MLQYYLLIFIGLIINVYSAYDSTRANIGVWLSGAAYCGKRNYLTMSLSGPATGFIVTNILYDPLTDLEGFIGYLSSSRAIWIVFRGSNSFLNWLDNFQVRQVDYTTWSNCSGCKVHNGFYHATLNLRNKTIDYIHILQKIYPTYDLYISGHSLGSAIADLMSMELASEGIKSNVYIYGKPRVGNQAYSEFYSKTIPNHYRHTHNKDIVPHLPPKKIDTQLSGYYHSCQEIFEDESGIITQCSNAQCEDPYCGDQYKLTQTNTVDHSYYLGHHLDCGDSTI